MELSQKVQNDEKEICGKIKITSLIKCDRRTKSMALQNNLTNWRKFNFGRYCLTESSALFLYIIFDHQKFSWNYLPYFFFFLDSLWFSYGFSVCGQFPDWTVPRLTLPRGQFPDWHFPDGNFPDGHFPERTISRRTLPQLDISPLRHFPEWSFPWPDISLTTCFSEIFFFKSFFVCLY